jgi:hypothetical protein
MASLGEFEPITEGEMKEVNSNRHYGNMIPLCFNSEGEPKYILGPHYYLFILVLLISTIVVVYILFRFCYFTHIGFVIGGAFSAVFYIWSYVKVGLSLPGIASNGSEPDFEVKVQDRYCVPCKIVRERGTRHCIFCDVCIYKYDHHCPWIGKCIGRDNLIAFYQFLCSIMVLVAILILGTVLGLQIK